ncbi:HTH_Tnp_Tc3_2 domain-containing protein [Trichonephila clavipes]|nr:HTH_Tnp_Tc3_2 domain-containing protein [Trichonephila clavipes]
MNVCPPTKVTCQFKVDDIVLIHDDRFPSNMWSMGKITETYTGRDVYRLILYKMYSDDSTSSLDDSCESVDGNENHDFYETVCFQKNVLHLPECFCAEASRRAVLLARWIVRSVPLEIVGEQWTREGTYAWKTGSGATRKTARRKDRRIVWQALVDPTVTRSMIRADVGVAIVPQTISRHLAESNLKSKRPFRALPLTPEHRQLRLQWCQAISMWNVTDWQQVVFSDESRFVLGTDDNRVRVWRRPGERYNSPHTVLRHIACTAGVMVWGEA